MQEQLFFREHPEKYEYLVYHYMVCVVPLHHGVKFQLGGTMKRNSTTTLNALSMSIDNLRVYDTRILSASEVKEIYEAEK